MSDKGCSDFIAAYRSGIITCISCKYWDNRDFICRNSEEAKRRREEAKFDSTDREMRGNKGVFLE